jgi:O-antigen ligase
MLVLGIVGAMAVAAALSGGAIVLDLSNRIRLSFWLAAAQAFVTHPFFGLGFSNIGVILTQFGTWFAVPHNAYITIGAEMGLAGVLVFLYALVGIYRQARKGSSDPLISGLGHALLYNALVLFFISEQMDPNLYILCCFILAFSAQRTAPNAGDVAGLAPRLDPASSGVQGAKG